MNKDLITAIIVEIIWWLVAIAFTIKGLYIEALLCVVIIEICHTRYEIKQQRGNYETS